MFTIDQGNNGKLLDRANNNIISQQINDRFKDIATFGLYDYFLEVYFSYFGYYRRSVFYVIDQDDCCYVLSNSERVKMSKIGKLKLLNHYNLELKKCGSVIFNQVYNDLILRSISTVISVFLLPLLVIPISIDLFLYVTNSIDSLINEIANSNNAENISKPITFRHKLFYSLIMSFGLASSIIALEQLKSDDAFCRSLGYHTSKVQYEFRQEIGHFTSISLNNCENMGVRRKGKKDDPRKIIISCSSSGSSISFTNNEVPIQDDLNPTVVFFGLKLTDLKEKSGTNHCYKSDEDFPAINPGDLNKDPKEVKAQNSTIAIVIILIIVEVITDLMLLYLIFEESNKENDRIIKGKYINKYVQSIVDISKFSDEVIIVHRISVTFDIISSVILILYFYSFDGKNSDIINNFENKLKFVYLNLLSIFLLIVISKGMSESAGIINSVIVAY